jgi:hypothetical protein
MSDRPDRGIALLYHRDSDGAAECAPAAYVEWTRRRADELGVTFGGSPEQIDAMIRRRVAADPPI